MNFMHIYRNSNKILSNLDESELDEIKPLGKRIRYLMANKSMNFTELEKLPLKFFNKHVKHIMDFLGQDLQDINETECNKDKECMRQVVMARLIYRMSNGGDNIKQLFGSFLKSFASIFLDDFNPDKMIKILCFKWACKKDICNTMKINEKLLHDYFANLSMVFGFSEKISLFDIPSLVSYISNSYYAKKPEFFMNFRCNKHIKVTGEDLLHCTKQLSNYNQNILKGIEGKIQADFLLSLEFCFTLFYRYTSSMP